MQPWQFQPHASDGNHERLAYMGNFELDVVHAYQHSECWYPGGGYESSLEGPLEGIARCNLVFKVVPDSQGQSILLSPVGEESLALYLFHFFQRHNSPAKKPFLCPHPLTEVDTLWRFVESNIQMKNVAARLWGTGFALVQHFGGEPFTNTQDNPNTI